MSIKKRIPKGCRRRVAVAYQDSMRRGQVVSETKGRLNSRIGPSLSIFFLQVPNGHFDVILCQRY
jgi:hypothetical protein